MSWNTSNRSAGLPADWKHRRSQVLRRDGYVCTLCGAPATEVDHLSSSDHSLAMLRSLCSRCHAKRSSQQGHARQRELKAQRRRPVERHPGAM